MCLVGRVDKVDRFVAGDFFIVYLESELFKPVVMVDVDRVDNVDKIDRKKASKIMNLSIRTVDRYIKQGKLSSRYENGRIWLKGAEVEVLCQQGKARVVVNKKSNSKSQKITSKTSGIQVMPGETGGRVSVGRQGDPTEVDRVDNVDRVDTMSTLLSTLQKHYENYKNLYEELQLEVRAQQKRLEAANYRVGQLEARLESSVPILEVTAERKAHSNQTRLLTEQLQINQKILGTNEKRLVSEKNTKNIYLIILFALLMLQPIWVWLSTVR